MFIWWIMLSFCFKNIAFAFLYNWRILRNRKNLCSVFLLFYLSGPLFLSCYTVFLYDYIRGNMLTRYRWHENMLPISCKPVAGLVKQRGWILLSYSFFDVFLSRLSSYQFVFLSFNLLYDSILFVFLLLRISLFRRSRRGDGISGV